MSRIDKRVCAFVRVEPHSGPRARRDEVDALLYRQELMGCSFPKISSRVVPAHITTALPETSQALFYRLPQSLAPSLSPGSFSSGAKCAAVVLLFPPCGNHPAVSGESACLPRPSQHIICQFAYILLMCLLKRHDLATNSQILLILRLISRNCLVLK
jgi:hypothetical protein